MCQRQRTTKHIIITTEDGGNRVGLVRDDEAEAGHTVGIKYFISDLNGTYLFLFYGTKFA